VLNNFKKFKDDKPLIKKKTTNKPMNFKRSHR
jgi:hypothetical protein